LAPTPRGRPTTSSSDRDGTGLVQLAEASVRRRSATTALASSTSASFFLTGDIQTGPADASSAPVTIATTSPYSSGVAFSGDGGTIVFDDSDTLRRINWDGSGLATVVSGSYPSITDGGQTVVYRAANGDYPQDRDGRIGDTLLVAHAAVVRTSNLRSSPATAVASCSWCTAIIRGSSMPDAGQELVAIDNAGASFGS
jgi:hypothetical protein